MIAGHDRQSAAREDARPVERWAPGAVCLRGEGPFVRLWTIPDGTAEDAAVPVVEAFVNYAGPLRSYVRGIHEFADKGGRVAGLFVDAAIPAAKLKRLRAALQRAAPGEPHEFVCRRPPILRAFDPVTGKPEP